MDMAFLVLNARAAGILTGLGRDGRGHRLCPSLCFPSHAPLPLPSLPSPWGSLPQPRRCSLLLLENGWSWVRWVVSI